MLPSISVPAFLKSSEDWVIIDVRSESEFEEAHIPGAINIPLLDDAGRAEVGTLYKKSGPDVARVRGLELVGPKLAAMMIRVDEAARRGSSGGTRARLLLHCWRGGSRSQSVAAVLAIMKYDVTVLEGGHKAFRQFVQDFLNMEHYPFKLCTLWGLTGSSKTEILRQWKREGKPVIDIEGLAFHRGSAFGQVGIDRLGKQKEFENTLFWEMWRLRHEPVVVVEGESKRVGRVQLPDVFLQAMLDGYRIQVSRNLDERVNHILSEYVEGMERNRMVEEAKRSLDAIKRKLGGEKHAHLAGLLKEGAFDKFTRILLIDYYDKLYPNSRADGSFYHARIHGAEDWETVRGCWLLDSNAKV